MEAGCARKVALVAPVHNRRETTLRALRSLSRIDTGLNDIRIFIVDDGSTDGTGDAIRAQFPEVEVINGNGELHYAAGTNLGVVHAMEWGADLIVTMNDDAVFHPLFLARMITTADRHPKSIVGALLLLWNEPHRVFQVDLRWQTLKGGWVVPDDLTAFTVKQEPFEVECIVGNCVLFPAEAIRNVGLMDEKSFAHGWGDAQWLSRMRKAGWRLLIEPKAYVWCEPNTNPKPLHTRDKREVYRILVGDERHPLNLKRQFAARWHSAPDRLSAVTAFAVFLLQLVGKSLRYSFTRRNA